MGDHDLVRLLVEAGAESNIQDTDGFTPLYCAAEMGDHYMARYLVELGAEVNT